MKVVDLKGNTMKDENKTFTQSFGINLQKHTDIFTKYITTNVCQKRGESESKNDIINFINTYNIDWKKALKCKNVSTIEDCAEKFKTLNDFFIRKIPINIKDSSETVFSSVADARTIYFHNEKYAKKIWVKGVNYCLKCMLKIGNNETLSNYYNDSHILISRLAPVDYHRFHSPVDGEFIGFYEIEGTYLSVDPIIVNSSKNVLSSNNRIILYIYSKYFGIIALSIVGATCVGSIKVHNHKIGYKIKKGEELGYFNFGGSTIVTVIPYNKNIDVIPELTKNSKKKIETYVEVGESLMKSKIMIEKENRIINEIKKKI